MGRGLLSGLFWGGAASMVALIIASLYFPMRDLAWRQNGDAAREAAAAQVEEQPQPAPDDASRSLLADPPPPAHAAEVVDTPPAEPVPLAGSEPTPDMAGRPAETPEEAPAETAQPAQLAPPPVPETAQAVPAIPDTATPTVTPQTPAEPPALAPTPGDGRVSAAPDSPTPVPEALPGALAALPGMPNAPGAGDAPVSGSAPAPTSLPEPDAAEVIAAPTPGPLIDDTRVALAAVPAPLPELPERPAGPLPPGAPGQAPAAQLVQSAPPTLIGETPSSDASATQADPAPRPLALAPFSAPDAQDSPLAPDLRLAALTNPITEGPPTPRALPTQEPLPEPEPAAEPAAEPAPEPDPTPEPAPEAEARPTDAPPSRLSPDDAPPETPTADQRPQAPEGSAPERTLPRRIIVGGGGQLGSGGLDGVSRLTANRTGVSNRLPQVGAASSEDGPEQEVTPETEDEAPVGALARNAQPWEGTGPRTAVVLQATSADRTIVDILAGIEAPLTVALDPAWPDAPARAATLREAGHEVLITLTGLPPRPQEVDIDVALNAHISRLPGAVGVFLPQDISIGTDRDLLTHLAVRLSQTGHGLVAEPRGLNVLEQIARAEGAALAAVDGVLAPQQPQIQTTRALDRAVFDATRSGSFILLGQTEAETLVALQSWALGGADALAPVSAVLREGS